MFSNFCVWEYQAVYLFFMWLACYRKSLCWSGHKKCQLTFVGGFFNLPFFCGNLTYISVVLMLLYASFSWLKMPSLFWICVVAWWGKPAIMNTGWGKAGKRLFHFCKNINFLVDGKSGNFLKDACFALIWIIENMEMSRNFVTGIKRKMTYSISVNLAVM